MNFDQHCTSAARLSILISLVQQEALTFTELKRVTGLADGNLHVQTRKLVQSGYIGSQKEMRGKRSLTRFWITEPGILALRLHSRLLQRVLDASPTVVESRPSSESGDDSQFW